MVLGDVTHAGCLWKTETAESTVTLKVDNLLTPIMGLTLVGSNFQAHPPTEETPSAAPAAPK